jgi:hypothetical protein
MVFRPIVAAALLLAGCGGEPAGSEFAALLRASSDLRLGAATSSSELRAWGMRHGLPGCEVRGWESDEVGVEYGGCSVDRVVLDGGEVLFAFALRREEWRDHDDLFLTGFRLAQVNVELMDPDGRRPDGLVTHATHVVWGAPTAKCDRLSVWVLPDRTAFLSAVSADHEPELVVQAPPRIDGRALACLAASGQSPSRTNGAQ